MVMLNLPAQETALAGLTGASQTQLFDALVAAQEQAARHEKDGYYEVEAARMQAQGHNINAEALRALDETNPALMDVLVGIRTPEAEKHHTEFARERSDMLPAGAMDASGTKHWAQRYIGRNETANWTALWPPARADHLGNLWQDPAVLVQRSAVPQKLLQGWRRHTTTPIRPKPNLACGIPAADGGPCVYRGYTDDDVLLHEAARHPKMFQMRQISEEREERSMMVAALQQIARMGMPSQQTPAVQLSSADIELIRKAQQSAEPPPAPNAATMPIPSSLLALQVEEEAAAREALQHEEAADNPTTGVTGTAEIEAAIAATSPVEGATTPVAGSEGEAESPARRARRSRQEE